MAEKEQQEKENEQKPKFHWTTVVSGVSTFAGGLKEFPPIRRNPRIYWPLWSIETAGGAVLVGGAAYEGLQRFKAWRESRVSTVTVQYC